MGKKLDTVLLLTELMVCLGRKTLVRNKLYAFSQACDCKCKEGKPREGAMRRKSQSGVLPPVV